MLNPNGSLLRALVLAPHPDDAELSCGGTIARLTCEGWDVRVAVHSPNDRSLPEKFAKGTLRNECHRALERLGVAEKQLFWGDFSVREFSSQRQEILEWLIEIRQIFKPTLVLCPGPEDCHQDHETIYREAIRAFKNSNILGYESPWNVVRSELNYCIRISTDDLNAKESALAEYKSQIEMGRPYFSDSFIRSWARFRGGQWASEYAEVYNLIRMSC